MGLIIGGGNTKSGGGGGDVRLETNHNATISENGTHVVTPTDGYDGMRKATIKVDVEAADPTDKALVANATQYGLSHNLYKVMEQVKADTRTQGYAAIMLCQYYKGYNSLSLEGGADAFLTSDGDFYVGNTTHYWHDANDEHFDRWVAMLFSSESGSYTCSNANICPRAALIDGTMGDIEFRASNMRFAWIDVTNDSSFGQVYASGNYDSLWNRQLVLRGMREVKQGGPSRVPVGDAKSALVGVKKLSAPLFGNASFSTISLEGLVEITSTGSICYGNGAASNVQVVIANDLIAAHKLFQTAGSASACGTNTRYIELKKCKSLTYIMGTQWGSSSANVGLASLIHLEIGEGYDSTGYWIGASFANCLKTDTNDLVEDLQAHPTWSNLDQWLWNFEHLIVDKLADLSGQTAKTITLAAAPYAAITESIRQKMSAKNWNLASA